MTTRDREIFPIEEFKKSGVPKGTVPKIDFLLIHEYPVISPVLKNSVLHPREVGHSCLIFVPLKMLDQQCCISGSFCLMNRFLLA